MSSFKWLAAWDTGTAMGSFWGSIEKMKKLSLSSVRRLYHRPSSLSVSDLFPFL
jgi:hypothetical protein